MDVPPLAKKIGIVLAKLVVLYLALVVLLVDFVLLMIAFPRILSEQQPFIQSAAITLLISAVVSVIRRSRTPVLFVVFCIAYSALAIRANVYHLIALLAFFCAVAAANFLYRNKVTEPLLVMLLVITGAWVFTHFVHLPYAVGWVYFVAGKRDFLGALGEGLAAVPDQMLVISLMAPALAMYFLGKHSYVPAYAYLASVYRQYRERLSS